MKTIVLLLIFFFVFAFGGNGQNFYKISIHAGELSSKINEIRTISHLEIIGNIDVRDFQILRDSLLVLEELDIKNTAIDSYVGNINGNGEKIYLRNEIPPLAFFHLASCPNLSLKKIILPENVVSINEGAFCNCSRLSSINFPEKLKKIESVAFSGCHNLTNIELPDSVGFIGAEAFAFCGIDSIEILPAVKEIQRGAFEYCFNLKRVKISSTLKVIPDWLFYNCQQLKFISLPATVNTIGSYAFYNCKELSSVILPKELERIGVQSFSSCSNLDTLTIPSGVKYIENNAFQECVKIPSVIFPSSMCTIGQGAFYKCSGIKRISFSSSIYYIYDYAFELCNQTETIISYSKNPINLSRSQDVFDGINKDKCVLYIPEGSKGFYQTTDQWKDFNHIIEMKSGEIITENNLQLEQAGSLSTLLTENEKGALIKLTLSGNIDARDFKTIRDEMPKLEELDLLNANIKLYYGAAGTYSQFEYRSYPNDQVPVCSFLGHEKLRKIMLPSSAVTIEQEAFRKCTNLKQVVIPEKVFVIADFAFYNCPSLDTVSISSNVNQIGPCAFADCSARIKVDPANPSYSDVDGVLFNKDKTILIQAPTILSGEYLIPETVETIGHDAFLNCRQLTAISLPIGVKSIEEWAFAYCTGLKSFKVFGPMPIDLSVVWEAVFAPSVFASCTLNVPKGTSELYKTASGWKEFVNIVEMESEPNETEKTVHLEQAGSLSTLLTENEKGALIKLTLSGNIDARDFKTMRDEMPKLEDLDLSEATILEYSGTEGTGVEASTYRADELPFCAFSSPGFELRTFKLKHIVFPKNLWSIQMNTFTNSCPYLTAISIPKYVYYIGPGAFSYCNQIETFSVDPENEYITSVDGVLYRKDLSELLIIPGNKGGTLAFPSSVKRIGDSAGHGTWRLEQVQLPEGTETIGSWAFNSSSIKSVNFPASLIDIGSDAFGCCSNLSSADFSKCRNLKTIEMKLFDGCIKLADLKLPRSVLEIKSKAFNSCSKLASIAVQNPLPPILGDDVFKNVDHSACVLYVPRGSKAAYQVADGWKDFLNIVETDFPDSVTVLSPSTLKVYVRQQILTIEGAARNSTWKIYNLLGQLCSMGSMNGQSSISLPLLETRPCIVCVNEKCFKVWP